MFELGTSWYSNGHLLINHVQLIKCESRERERASEWASRQVEVENTESAKIFSDWIKQPEPICKYIDFETDWPLYKFRISECTHGLWMLCERISEEANQFIIIFPEKRPLLLFDINRKIPSLQMANLCRCIYGTYLDFTRDCISH